MKIFDKIKYTSTLTKFSPYISLSQRAWMRAVCSITAEQGRSYQKFAWWPPDLIRTQFSLIFPSGWLEYQLV